MKCLFMLIIVGLKHVKKKQTFKWSVHVNAYNKNVLLLINFFNKKTSKHPLLLLCYRMNLLNILIFVLNALSNEQRNLLFFL